jgi:hypothetical protein
MRLIRCFCFTLLALTLVSVAAQANPAPPPSFSKFLRMLGAPGVPAEWAGIWEFADTTRMCDSTQIEDTDAGFDTLCMDDSYDPDTSNAFQCSGTATSTEVDITCTGFFTISGGCTDTITYHLQATRTGETVTYIETLKNNYSRPACPPIPDTCQRTTGVLTRIAPAPKSCATPTQRTTWGRVKALYR